jgi:hypothetical protein
MAGLVPAIHAGPLRITFGIDFRGLAWKPGTRRTRPGMTAVGWKRARKTAPIL